MEFGEIIMVIFGVKEQKIKRILQLEITVYKNDCLVYPERRKEFGLEEE